MNKSNVEHAVFAVIMQLTVYLLTGNIVAGACFGYAFFLGREHAQFEYKLTGGGPVGNLNPLAGFAFWKWGKDAQLDLLFPATAVAVVVGVIKWM
jgi:hypothetical protein